MSTRSLKIGLFAAFLLLTTVNIGWVFSGRPVTRPLWMFVGVGMSLTFTMFIAIWNDRNPAVILGCIIAGFTAAATLRYTGYTMAPSVGFDWGRWLARTHAIHHTGHVTGSDMYRSSPIFLISVAIHQSILSFNSSNIRFITIFISVLTVGLIGAVAYILTSNHRIGIVALLLGATFPLLLRVSVLLEGEHLVIGWFLTIFILFIRSYRNRDTRFDFTLVIIITSSVFLHFFYSVVAWVIIFGPLLGYYILSYTRYRGLISEPKHGRLVPLLMVSALVILSWQLWSVYAQASVLTLVSGLTLPDQISLWSTGGNTAVSRGTGSSSNGLQSKLKYVPLIIVLSIGGLGGLISILSHRYRETPGILLAFSIGIVSTMFIIVGLDYNLGFRMFYFISIIAIVFAAVGLVRLPEIFPRKITTGILVISILIFATISPITPLGNNTDPRLGGSSWALSTAENEELQAMSPPLPSEGPIKTTLQQVHPHFLPSSPDGKLSRRCQHTHSTVMDTGTFIICHNK